MHGEKVRACAKLTLRVEVRGKVGVENSRVPKRALFRDLLELQSERMETSPQGFHKEQVFLLRELDQSLGLSGVGRGGLLAQNVLPGIQRVDRIFVVQSVRRS